MNKDLTSQGTETKISHNTIGIKPLRWLMVFASMSAWTLTSGMGTQAQELPGCFLKNQAGNYVRLNSICVFPEMELDPTSTASSATPGVYQAQIIDRKGGIPIIEVVFNENQTFKMLVDTGASGTAITPVMAEMLGVIPSGRGIADTPSEKNVEFDIGLVQSINVAGAKMSNVAVAIAPELDLGLLGQDFFGRYDVTIKEDVIEFRERG